ncbi:MAG: hypothetical protein ACP5EN_12990 [Rhodovulum sp.]
MDLGSAITAISQTVNLAKGLRSVEHKLDLAELKLRLSEVIDGLLDAKQALQEAKQNEWELQNTISQLEQRLEEQGKYRDKDGLLFALDDEGKEVGDPFCNLCFVREGKRYRMRFNNFAGGNGYQCDNCGNVFLTGRRSSNLRTGYDVQKPYG